MIGLDTNILVRYLAQDDPRQSALATHLIERKLTERAPGYVSLVVVVELCWVLQHVYGATAAETADTLHDMLAMPVFVFQEREIVQDALEVHRAGRPADTGLPDILVAQLAKHAGCVRVLSFDKDPVRSAAMTSFT